MSTVNIAFDEVGRGSLCGPVTTCCVLENQDYPFLTYHNDKEAYINQKNWYQSVRDSKKVSSKIRASIFENAVKDKVNYLILNASNKLIDKYGVGVCLTYMLYVSYFYYDLRGFKINNLNSDGKIRLYSDINEEVLHDICEENKESLKNNFYNLVSQNFSSLSEINSKIIRIVKGDDLYFSIALASNIAKVTRDQYMSDLDLIYPHFGWKNNKGYGTEINRKAIKLYPNNQYLRHSFLKNIFPPS